MNVRGVNCNIHEDTCLWRYFSLQKFISFLFDKSIIFSRMDSLEDMNEAISQNQLIKQFGTSYERKKIRQQENERKKPELDINDRQKRYYVSCWVNDKRESIAMWNIYSDKDGLAIRVKASALINLVKKERDEIFTEKINGNFNLYYGNVDYKDFLDKKERLNMKSETQIIGFHKDISFSYEKEFRFLLKFNSKTDKDFKYSTQKMTKMKLVNFSDIAIELYFHPRMESWKKSNIKKLIKLMGYNNVKIKASALKLSP